MNQWIKKWLLGRQDEETDEVIKNASLVYNNQLKCFDGYILKNKQQALTKRISSEKLFKPRLSSSPLSLRFLSQKAIAEKLKLKPQERKKQKQHLKY